MGQCISISVPCFHKALILKCVHMGWFTFWTDLTEQTIVQGPVAGLGIVIKKLNTGLSAL
jgi:hypothetical protein